MDSISKGYYISEWGHMGGERDRTAMKQLFRKEALRS